MSFAVEYECGLSWRGYAANGFVERTHSGGERGGQSSMLSERLWPTQGQH